MLPRPIHASLGAIVIVMDVHDRKVGVAAPVQAIIDWSFH